jgi:DNA-binding response OmpR family regulator
MGHRILIVEDDPAIRMLAKSVLEAEGYLVDEAECPGAGDPAAADLVLLDIGFGFEALDALADVPVLVLTAWAAPELLAEATAHGALGHVQKPFDVGELRERVDAALPAPVIFAQAA